jgi:putative transcriptional regulator
MGPVEGTSATGKLLVSSPSMTDLNFDRSVVFVLEHGEEGALGVVLNRPTRVGLSEAVPSWASLACDPKVVFLGGPVGQGSVLALARSETDAETGDFTPLLGRVGVLDISRDPGDLDVVVDEIRLFTGYSDDPLSQRPESLWSDVLKRGEGVRAMREQDPRRHWLN